jgi:uncharacterized protein (DUF433 family)
MSTNSGRFEGIYDVPSAARYLLASRMAREAYPVKSRSLIRWIRKGLALPELAEVPGRELLIAFEDLISMRIIAALRAYGVSWPRIHAAERWLREHTGHERPFATEEIWTERSDVFAYFRDMLITASRHGQMAFTILEEYIIPVSGLTFERRVARTWEPSPFILLNPSIQFGAPCIKGTRIPTHSVWGMIEGGDPAELVLRSYGITEEELDAAVAWEERLAA